MTTQRSPFILTVVLLTPVSICFGKYSGGNGSPENPYKIATAEDMNEIGANLSDWSSHFLLTDDGRER